MIVEIKIAGKKYRYDLVGTNGQLLSKNAQDVVRLFCNNLLAHLYRENVFFKKFMDTPKEKSVLEREHSLT